MDSRYEKDFAREENNSMPEKEALPDDVIVILRTSGGILPIQREWIFYSDGRICHPDGNITSMEKGRFDKLIQSEQIDKIAALASHYEAPDGSADFMTIELILRSSAGLRKITYEDSSSSVPDELLNYIDKLQKVAR